MIFKGANNCKIDLKDIKNVMSFLSLEKFKVKLATFIEAANSKKKYVLRQYSGKEYLKMEKSEQIES